jgi:hypothetical protein
MLPATQGAGNLGTVPMEQVVMRTHHPSYAPARMQRESEGWHTGGKGGMHMGVAVHVAQEKGQVANPGNGLTLLPPACAHKSGGAGVEVEVEGRGMYAHPSSPSFARCPHAKAQAAVGRRGRARVYTWAGRGARGFPFPHYPLFACHPSAQTGGGGTRREGACLSPPPLSRTTVCAKTVPRTGAAYSLRPV